MMICCSGLGTQCTVKPHQHMPLASRLQFNHGVTCDGTKLPKPCNSWKIFTSVWSTYLRKTHVNLIHILGLHDGTPDFSDKGLDAGPDAWYDALAQLDPDGWQQWDEDWYTGKAVNVEPSVETTGDFGEGDKPKIPAGGLTTSDDERDDGEWCLKIPPEGLQVGGRFFSRADMEWEDIDGESCC